MSVKVLLEGLDFGRAPYGLDSADELTVARSILAVGRALPLFPLPPTLAALRPTSLGYEVCVPSGVFRGCSPPKRSHFVPPLREDGNPGILSLESSWEEAASQLDTPRHLKAQSC